jgi:carboxyl-terminal processing protease
LGRWVRCARLVAICLALAVAAGCERGRNPSTATTTPPPGGTTAPSGTATARLPEGYLDDAMDLIRRNAYYAGRVDWPAARAEARRRAGVTRQGAYDAIRWVLSELGDGHSFLLTPEEVRAAEAGSALSFGLTALFPERVVVDVEPGGGAERAGARVGDVVESVDGRPVQGDGTVRLPAPMAGGRPARTVLGLRRGRWDQARQRQVAIEAAGASAVRPPTVRRLSGGVAALELFGISTAEGREAFRYLEAAHDGIRRLASRRTCGWVVDLRRDRGGSVPPMLVAVGPMLGDGRAVGYRDKNGATTWYGYADGAVFLDSQPQWSLAASRPAQLPRPAPPVAVLTSRLTASAGVAVVMAFRGRPRARSFGEATAGVPTGNAQHRLADGADST